MVREGCFDDVDFAYAWHPMFETGIMNKTLANVRVIYDFTGKRRKDDAPLSPVGF